MTSRPKRWLLLFLSVYLVALGLSHLKRSLDPVESAPEGGQKIFVAGGYGEDEGEPVAIAYLDKGPQDGVPALLIHGSPIGSAVFDRLIAELPQDLRLIAPDLPGHGNSARDVDDASFEADAHYLHQLLGELQIPSAHVVAYSRGGGPALQLAERYPDEVRSLILVSSLGVQEQELLGNYTLNNALHSLQLGFFLLVEELLPHFGYLDDAVLNSDYARSFSDSDQRPLRDILARVEVPTLILHGKDDLLVPISAAREHHRIVPHSELEEIRGGHIFVVTEARKVAQRIDRFVNRSEEGIARIRSEASPERLLRAAEERATNPDPPSSRGGLFFLAGILFLATFASEDLTCIVAGILVAAGTLSYPLAVLICFSGILVGDMIIFLGGRLFGSRAVKYPPFRWVLTPDRLDAAQGWFHRRGAVVILTSRFVPGTRLAVYFAAGMARTSTAWFLLYFLIAACLWTPLVVGLAMLVGNPLLEFFARVEHWALPALFGLILLLVLLTKVLAPLITSRGRRIAYGSWKRKLRWEFWPRWLFYPPVVLWILWLGLRYRKPSLFTTANPGIEASGIAFESKSRIYQILSSGQGRIARTLCLRKGDSEEEWTEQIRAFQEELPAPYPLVCKPDSGERGTGVSIVHRAEDLPAALLLARPNPIIQEFIPGLEYGVFFEKKPSEATGRVTSITRKVNTSVRGDGEMTLEELILSDDRAVCTYPYFCRRHRERLHWVPAAGEEYVLADLGSHCRGSVFLDGQALLTPQLAAAVNQIFVGTEGLCFGRLDLKCPSDEDFRKGKNLAVLEFNGITSESTHIYDPQHSLLFAYRHVFAQWSRAFELANENWKAGHEPWSAIRTLRLMIAAVCGRPGGIH